MSTTIYDGQDRVTDTYGPAPSSCFGTDRKPVTGCAITPAHTSMKYDEGFVRLNAEWYDNAQLAGLPKSFPTGTPGVLAGREGQVNRDWAGGSPVAGIPTTNWSVRLTGTITFPAAGTYEFQTWSDDGSQLWIDDNKTVDFWRAGSWAASPTGEVIVTAQKLTSRIRVQFYQASGASALAPNWRKKRETTWQPVPGTASRRRRHHEAAL